MKTTRKLVIYPDNVWKDVAKYVKNKYNLTTPNGKFSMYRLLHGSAFNKAKYVKDCKKEDALELLSHICEKFDINFLKISEGHVMTTIEENHDDLLKLIDSRKVSMNSLEESHRVHLEEIQNEQQEVSKVKTELEYV